MQPEEANTAAVTEYQLIPAEQALLDVIREAALKLNDEAQTIIRTIARVHHFDDGRWTFDQNTNKFVRAT